MERILTFGMVFKLNDCLPLITNNLGQMQYTLSLVVSDASGCSANASIKEY